MRGARVKPTVKRVGFLGELLAAAMRAGKACRQNVSRFCIKPSIRALFTKEARYGINAFLIANGLFAVLAVEYGNGQAPMTLTGNAPIGTLTHHRLDALAAPLRQPLHLIAGIGSLVFKGIYRAEPLRCCTEDNGSLAAPAVRVLVLDLLTCKQCAAFLHISKDSTVALIVAHACKLTCLGSLVATVINGNKNINVIAAAGLIVIRTKAGRSVHTARTAIHGNVISIYNGRKTVKEGMLCRHVFKILTLHRKDHLILRNAADRHGFCKQRLGNDIARAVCRLCHNVGFIGIQGNGNIAGQGPGSGRPDHKIGIRKIANTGKLALVVCHTEFYINGRAGIGLVFDLCLSECCFILRAPINRLKTLINVALAVHFAKHAHLARFKLGRHGKVGMIPITRDAKTLELLHLNVYKILGKIIASTAELRNRHALAVKLVLLDDRTFNGHAMVIPTGNVGHSVTHHAMRFVDKILKNLIQSMPHVNVAIREGGTVVKHEGGLACTHLLHLVVKLDLLPIVEHLRLALGQLRTHCKRGAGEIE